MKEINKLIKYSIIYMNYTTYLGLLFIFISLGVFCADTSSFNNLSKRNKIFGIVVILILIVLPPIIDKFTEKGYTLKKFVNYYDLQYGDSLDFIYHIKTDHVKDTTKRPPKCKISGEISNNTLTITKMEKCDSDEEAKDKYSKLISDQISMDNNENISKGSRMTNFVQN